MLISRRKQEIGEAKSSLQDLNRLKALLATLRKNTISNNVPPARQLTKFNDCLLDFLFSVFWTTLSKGKKFSKIFNAVSKSPQFNFSPFQLDFNPILKDSRHSLDI